MVVFLDAVFWNERQSSRVMKHRDGMVGAPRLELGTSCV